MRGLCDDCGKSYRLPDSDRTYRCKSCGGSVRAESAGPQQELLEDAAVCSQCQALNPPETRFCEECGTPLTAPTRSGPRRGDVLDRAQANRDIGKALRLVRSMRILYGTMAALALFFAGLASLALAFGEAEVGLWSGLLVYLVLAGLFVAGVLRIKKEPFLWALILASYMTINLVLTVVVSGWPGLLLPVFTVGLWFCVVPMVRVRNLLQRYPDLKASTRWSARREKGGKGELATRSSRRSRAERRDGSRKVLMYGGGTAAVAIAIGLVAYQLTRPPQLAHAMEEFSEAWNQSQFEVVKNWFAPEKKDGFDRVVERHGWEKGLPALKNEPTVDRIKEGRFRAIYVAEGQEMRFYWEFVGDRWVMQGLMVPRS